MPYMSRPRLAKWRTVRTQPRPYALRRSLAHVDFAHGRPCIRGLLLAGPGMQSSWRTIPDDVPKLACVPGLVCANPIQTPNPIWDRPAFLRPSICSMRCNCRDRKSKMEATNWKPLPAQLSDQTTKETYSRAFSNEVDAGSSQKMRPNKKQAFSNEVVAGGEYFSRLYRCTLPLNMLFGLEHVLHGTTAAHFS